MKMKYLPGDYRLILSAGRTGTLLLSRALTHSLGGVIAEHEPPPARWEHVWANLRHHWQTRGTWLQNYLRRNRLQRLTSLSDGHPYIEINPMLCPCADLLPTLFERLRLVHMVRDPKSWAVSILKFKASHAWRGIIDFIPYGLPYPAPRPCGWRQMPIEEKTLWRWNFCNQMIWSIRHQCETYEVVKYEDLFSAEASQRDAALRRLLEALALDAPPDMSWFPIQKRTNVAPEGGRSTDTLSDDVVAGICGPLAGTLGYGRAATSAPCQANRSP